MNISKRDLSDAAKAGVISHEQAENLWKHWNTENPARATFDFIHVAYYFGAMLIISSMAWFLTSAWESLGGTGIFGVSLLYMLAFCFAGKTFWFDKNLKTPGGLLFTVAVSITPLAVYGLERSFGIWPQGDPGNYHDYHIWIKGSWLFMEIATLLVGALILYFVRFPFLTAPMAFTLWYMSMDVTPMLFGGMDFTYQEKLYVSICFGLAMLLGSFAIDRRTKEDFAFWGYFFGLMAFWGGLSLMNSNSELNKFLYCLINVGLITVSIILDRRVFIVFGALGVTGYLGHLSYSVFKDSIFFPFALTLLGILILGIGVVYGRNRAKIEKAVLYILPPSLAKFREHTRS